MAADGRRVLVVEDEPAVAAAVERHLTRDGYQVLTVGDGDAALRLADSFRPDLVVVDAGLSGVGGVEVCRRIRARTSTPVIMVTALSRRADPASAHAHGAGGGPSSPRELAARSSTVSPRAERLPHRHGDVLRFDDLRIDSHTRTAVNARGPLRLTTREFDLLLHLASRPGEVFTREDLMRSVWGYTVPGDTSTVTVHMRRLRVKVEREPSRPRYLKTVWGVGYTFEP